MGEPHHPNLTGSAGYMCSPDEDGRVRCTLCAHGCSLLEGRKGLCGVRARRGDAIVSLVYGRVVAEHVDPVEKKPIFHLLPGSLSYSIATPGCNFRCLHCQNASISQVSRGMDVATAGVFRRPGEIVEAAQATGCRSISYTYVEPTIFFEFAYDCCVEAQARGLKNIFVSNGYMSDTVIEKLAPVVAAINIDLKSFSDDFYRRVCGARLAPVLHAIRRFRELGVWVEVTTLVIPGENDSERELGEIAAFLAGIDQRMPWHVTGFYPTYKMTDRPPTGEPILARARQLGFDHGLQFVYAGNRPGSGGENTLCPGCGKTLISRVGFRIQSNRLKDGSCPDCGQPVAGVWR